MATSTSPSAPPETPLRLLHASDLHLERVPTGLTEIPDHLRSQLVDCSYAAARRLFETAIAEGVDGVLLAGDVVDLSLAGPRAIVFLREQFDLLAAKGIEVYWAGGRVDPPHAWPRVSPLPPSVHVFPVDHVQHVDLRQRGEVRARVAGMSSNGDAQPSLSRFVPHPDGLLTIGVTYGRFSQANLANQLVPYMAAGGRHHRKSFAAGDRTRLLHYPGASQGTSPHERGPHGCTLVTFATDGTIQTQALATDAFRWQSARVEVDASTDLAALERQLAAQAEALRSHADSPGLFVRWQITGRGSAIESLRHAGARRAVVERLRSRFGHDAPYLWTVKLEVRRPAALAPALFEEETILGDVLRAIRKLQQEPAESLDLASYVSDSDRSSPFGRRLTDMSPDEHQRILEETSDACVALLSGDDDDAMLEHPTRTAG